MELSVSSSVILLLLRPITTTTNTTTACPPDWSDVRDVGLGCLLFSSQPMFWTEAEQYCSSAASNASMIEILSQQVRPDKNKIFSQ